MGHAKVGKEMPAKLTARHQEKADNFQAWSVKDDESTGDLQEAKVMFVKKWVRGILLGSIR